MNLENKAAIFLEEHGISGDAMINLDTEEGSAVYLNELLAWFAAKEQNICWRCGANLKYTTAFENGVSVCDACGEKI